MQSGHEDAAVVTALLTVYVRASCLKQTVAYFFSLIGHEEIVLSDSIKLVNEGIENERCNKNFPTGRRRSDHG